MIKSYLHNILIVGANMKLSDLIAFENNRTILEKVKQNKENIIPFVGAGVSCGCGLYTWNDLLERIASGYFTKKEISELKKLDSLDFADAIIKKVNGNTAMIMRQISDLFANAKVKYTDVPYILLDEFSPLLITTNYDNILESVTKKSYRGEIPALLPCLQGQVTDAIQLNEKKLIKIGLKI